jgi:hypothetical protein
MGAHLTDEHLTDEHLTDERRASLQRELAGLYAELRRHERSARGDATGYSAALVKEISRRIAGIEKQVYAR